MIIIYLDANVHYLKKYLTLPFRIIDVYKQRGVNIELKLVKHGVPDAIVIEELLKRKERGEKVILVTSDLRFHNIALSKGIPSIHIEYNYRRKPYKHQIALKVHKQLAQIIEKIL